MVLVRPGKTTHNTQTRKASEGRKKAVLVSLYDQTVHQRGRESIYTTVGALLTYNYRIGPIHNERTIPGNRSRWVDSYCLHCHHHHRRSVPRDTHDLDVYGGLKLVVSVADAPVEEEGNQSSLQEELENGGGAVRGGFDFD